MDIMQREGKYPVPPDASTILGVEFSGIIAEVGPNVDHWKEGDEVFGLASGVSDIGGYQRRTKTFTGRLRRIHCCKSISSSTQAKSFKLGRSSKSSRSLLDRSCRICFLIYDVLMLMLIAFQALVVIGEVKKNDNVLVHAGASGVGLVTIQLARQYGA
jgi:NADPH:quinone reductase-like Zn-dependent oxidoreductase